MEWLSLLLVVGLYAITCCISYSEEFKQSNYYYPAGFAVGLLTTLIWFTAVRSITEKEKLYFYSLCWDFVMISVFYFFPILFLGIKVNKIGLVGIGLMVVGLIIVKVKT